MRSLPVAAVAFGPEARWPGVCPPSRRCTTSSAAALCGVDDRLGTLAPGKLADITVIEGDLADLDKVGERVWGAWKEGSRVV